MLYPTGYEEMCCISALEACTAGVVPVLSAIGALPERVQNSICLTLPSVPAPPDEFLPKPYADLVIKLLEDDAFYTSHAQTLREAVNELSAQNIVRRVLNA